MENLQDFGIPLIQALQTLSPLLDVPMKILSFMGTVEFYLLLIPFIYWNVNQKLGFRVLLALICTDFLGLTFKQLLHQPRPYWVSDVKALATETSYGIPSSHASDSFAVWGVLALSLRRAWLWIAAVLLVILIGISRLYLGVHFPHDVLAGWFLGFIVLFLFYRYEPAFVRWLQPRSTGFRIGIGFSASLIFILLGLGFQAAIGPASDPESFANFSKEARTLSPYFTLAGALFGAVAGYELMLHRARFKAGASWGKHVLRYLLGIIGVLVIYLGLDALFGLIAADETIAGYILRYIRYGVVTVWATFGAPWAFLKLNLAEWEFL